MARGDDLIYVHCIRHVYPDKTDVSICGLEFVVREGERVAILGPNASGKTTLLYHLVGLLKPQEGTVRVMGEDVGDTGFRERLRDIGMVFQNVDEQIIGPTVWDDVAFSPINYGLPADEVEERVERALQEMDITHLAQRIPHYLSGGEKKKVALAGAIAMNPRVLILDEPFTGLDPASRDDLIEELNQLNKRHGTALVISTHDVDLIPQIADRIYLIHDGAIVLAGEPDVVFAEMEILRNAKLEPPVLHRLFDCLRKRGLEINPPKDVESAAEAIINLWDH